MLTKKLLLYFPKCEVEKPIVYHLVKDYDLMVNIFRAKVTPEEEGYLLLDVTGSAASIEQAIAYVKTFNVTVSETRQGLRWEENNCTSCGNCLSHCPTKALHLTDTVSRKVSFASERCIDCLSCLNCCPFAACTAVF